MSFSETGIPAVGCCRVCFTNWPVWNQWPTILNVWLLFYFVTVCIDCCWQRFKCVFFSFYDVKLSKKESLLKTAFHRSTSQHPEKHAMLLGDVWVRGDADLERWRTFFHFKCLGGYKTMRWRTIHVTKMYQRKAPKIPTFSDDHLSCSDGWIRTFFHTKSFKCNALWSIFANQVNISAHWFFSKTYGKFLGLYFEIIDYCTKLQTNYVVQDLLYRMLQCMLGNRRHVCVVKMHWLLSLYFT